MQGLALALLVFITAPLGASVPPRRPKNRHEWQGRKIS